MIVTVVAPALLNVPVVNVPVPAVVTVIVAVRPVDALGPTKLYVTVYVPTGRLTADEFVVMVEVPPMQTGVAFRLVKLYVGHV